MILEIRPTAAAEITPNDSSASSSQGSARSEGAPTAAIDRWSYARVSREVEKTSGGEAPVQNKPAAAKSVGLWEKESFGFADFIDIINPLQHIPIVSSIYRKLSGDKIAMAPRVIGGALWGRIGGFVSGVLNAVVEWFTGKDIGDHIISAITDKLTGPSHTNAVASVTEPRTVEAAAVTSAAPAIADPPVTEEQLRGAAPRFDDPAPTPESEPSPLSNISSDTPCILAAPIVHYRAFAKLDDDDNDRRQKKFHLSA